MNAGQVVAAMGFWPAVPIVGYWLLESTGTSVQLPGRLVRFAIAAAAGIAIWSPLLLLLLVTGLYAPPAIGILGWIVVGAFALWVSRRPARGRMDRTSRGRGPASFDAWDAALTIVFLVAAFLYLGFPGEFVIGGRDENSYALHGLWIAEHHRLDIPYPWPDSLHSTFYDAFLRFTGTFRTEPVMTPAFGHVLPVWLAQAASSFGYEGMQRLNGAFSLLAVAAFYGVARVAVPKPFAVLAAAVLALNPAQVWVSRTTLTEILTQLLLWAGLFLLMQALREASSRHARWAGLLVAAAVLVRIDMLIALPLLFLAHGAYRVVTGIHYVAGSTWRALYQTLVPGVGLAIGYYLLFSRPYALELAPQLAQVALVGVVALATLLVALRLHQRVELRSLIASRSSLIVIGCLLAALTAYAYLIRPIHEPFATFGPQQVLLAGKRTYAEDALPNLAAYLSPAVVLTGIGGWFIGYWLAARERHASWVPLLVVGGGFAALYLTNPAVTPDHFWAVRRVLPAVIPAVVAFSAVGAWWLFSTLGRRWTAAVVATCIALFVAWAGWNMRPFLFVSEHNGYRSELQAVAQQLPRDEIVLALNQERWWKPLYMLFGRHVVDIDLSSGRGRAAFRTWVERELDGDRRPLVLSVGDELYVPGLRYEIVSTTPLSRSQHRGTSTPLPTEMVEDTATITLYRVNGADTAYDYRNTNLVDGLVWGTRRAGLHDRELYQGTAVTWTDGSAMVTVPIRGPSPTVLRLSVVASSHAGATFRILANGYELYDGPLPGSSRWDTAFSLESVPAADALTIEVISDSRMVSRQVQIDGSLYRQRTETRAQGIAVHSLVLADLPPSE